MTAYNTTTLENLYIHQQIDDAVDEKYMPIEVAEAIKLQKPVDLYMPNYFVKIGFGFLTFFIVVSTAGLFVLFFNINYLMNAFAVVFGLCCYIALEVITRQKKHYNSGVDTILMTATVVFITVGSMRNHYGIIADLFASLIVFVLSSWLMFRFADRLAAFTSFAALLSLIYHGVALSGKTTLLLVPLLFILVSGIIYISFKHRYHSTANLYFKPVWQIVFIIALLGFYVSGNIFVAEKLTEGVKIPMVLNIFYWTWTILIPIFYLWPGLKTKEITFIRSGILFIALGILTYRYYHPILPPEIAMLFAGIFLTLLSYFFMKYLKSQRFGFIFDNSRTTNKYENVDGLIIGQAFGHQSHEVKQNTEFGGGKFGGGGAGSDF